VVALPILGLLYVTWHAEHGASTAVLDRSPPSREADANVDERRPENGVARRTGEETAMDARSADRPRAATAVRSDP
jgi:hypothetical protein